MITHLQKKELKSLEIDYWFENIPFGLILIAKTKIGICFISPVFDKIEAIEALKIKFRGATIREKSHTQNFWPIDFASTNWNNLSFHLMGTKFQLEVWDALLQIPFASTITYGSIAQKIGKPKAFRAVGTAVGHNPIFILIPCHRVLPATGKIGDYLWGSALKETILKWEKAQI
jgi:AraC family transcriptional regulator, regulatory protein of adaptative response / methylated-DNA-[protein]-cysteine methyltransferase